MTDDEKRREILREMFIGHTGEALDERVEFYASTLFDADPEALWAAIRLLAVIVDGVPTTKQIYDELNRSETENRFAPTSRREEF